MCLSFMPRLHAMVRNSTASALQSLLIQTSDA
jgi:hypothetical protein